MAQRYITEDDGPVFEHPFFSFSIALYTSGSLSSSHLFFFLAIVIIDRRFPFLPPPSPHILLLFYINVGTISVTQLPMGISF
jgi:hypothetical protein